MTKKLPPANDWQAREDTYEYILKKVKDGDLLVKNGRLYRTYERIGRGPKRLIDSPVEVGKKYDRGYIRYSFRLNGKSRSVAVHRIIYAVANNLDRIDPKLVINHINGDKTDNRPENLELVTQKENIAHSIDAGLKCLERNNTTKLSWEKVDEIRKLLTENRYSNREIGDMYGVSKCTIRHIRIGKSWIRGRGAYEKRKNAVSKGLAK